MRKKKFLYFAAGFGAIATLGLSVLGVKAALPTTATECEHVGNHYEAVGATQLHAGNQEFWACCNCHEQFIAQPATGTWTDMGAYAGETLDAAHPAYVAPAAADAVIGKKIYTYDTESDGRTPNFHNTYSAGGTTWLEEFNGEYGVRKTPADITNELRFDIGNTVVDFTSVKVRVYFESEASSVKLASHWVNVAEGIPTNQWVTLTITRNKIFSANTNFSNSGGHVDTAENFLADVFGTIGYTNQQAFYFHIYADGNLIKPAVYISWISTVLPEGEGDTLLMGYDVAGNGDGTQLAPNFHSGGSTWIEEFNGELGVFRTNNASNTLKIGLGSKKTNFDYIKIRIYFEVDGISDGLVRLYSHYAPIADGYGSADYSGCLYANQWATLKINKASLMTPGSAWGVSGGAVDTDANFYEAAFGQKGWYNQDIVNLTIYGGLHGGDGLKDANVYVSWVAAGVNPVVE